MFSRESLELFDTLLNQVTISVGASDFEDVVPQVLKARRELADALANEA